MDAPEPPRRWWHSHERTILLVIAIIAALPLGQLGSQAQIVMHRRAMRKQIEADGGRCFHFTLIVWPWFRQFWPVIVITAFPRSGAYSVMRKSP